MASIYEDIPKGNIILKRAENGFIIEISSYNRFFVFSRFKKASEWMEGYYQYLDEKKTDYYDL